MSKRLFHNEEYSAIPTSSDSPLRLVNPGEVYDQHGFAIQPKNENIYYQPKGDAPSDSLWSELLDKWEHYRFTLSREEVILIPN